MTVVAWDGKMLASDRMASLDTLHFEVTKIKKHRGELLFAAGDFGLIQAMFTWYREGAKPDKMPQFQSHENDWVPFHVIKRDGRIMRYERCGHPFEVEAKFYATGSGRDFAIAAMHLGKSAKEAVEIACKFSPNCGGGIDVLKLK